MERKLKAKSQGEEEQGMVIRGRRARVLRYQHAGCVGGQGELEIVEVTGKQGWRKGHCWYGKEEERFAH